ncbi:MAG: RNA polymerase sigma factor [Spirochaetes bacterium]|nr:RNA polymerase sigma factor [Spirochaetota bacterium]
MLDKNDSKNQDFLWIEEFQEGNEMVFEKLIDKHKNFVFNLCFRILNEYEEAEDACQDIFLKVHKGLKKFQFKAAFTTWLYRIVVNTCKNRLNSKAFRNKKRTSSLETHFHQSDEATKNPEENYENKETLQIVLKAIDQLPIKYKILIVLRDLENKSYEEMSEITSLKIGTVKSQLFRARELLRTQLAGVLP